MFARADPFVHSLAFGTARKCGPGDVYYLHCDTVHTITVDALKPTCLLIFQFADHPTKERTNLYSLSGDPPMLEGLYRRPNAAQVNRLRERAREFFR
jgi:hypothetical protein